MSLQSRVPSWVSHKTGMRFFVNVFLTIISVSLLCEARNLTQEGTDRSEPLSYDPIFPGTVADLERAPKYGVFDTEYLKWSDEQYLYYDQLDYRTISTMICSRKSHGGRLIGLQAAYRLAYLPANQWTEHFASYHGWSNWNGLRTVSKRMQLDTEHGESISKVTFRVCGRHWEGIKIETSKGQFIECGDWNFGKPAQDKSCYNSHGKTLTPPLGRKVIGLFGEAKGRAGSIEQGIRGLGFLTVPAP